MRGLVRCAELLPVVLTGLGSDGLGNETQNGLGFAILYNHQGVVQRYFPDFIIKLKNGGYLVLETKGQDKEKDKTNRSFLDQWCKAVNQHGGFGKWNWAVSFDPNDLPTIIQKFAT